MNKRNFFKALGLSITAALAWPFIKNKPAEISKFAKTTARTYDFEYRMVMYDGIKWQYFPICRYTPGNRVRIIY